MEDSCDYPRNRGLCSPGIPDKSHIESNGDIFSATVGKIFFHTRKGHDTPDLFLNVFKADQFVQLLKITLFTIYCEISSEHIPEFCLDLIDILLTQQPDGTHLLFRHFLKLFSIIYACSFKAVIRTYRKVHFFDSDLFSGIRILLLRFIFR